MWFCRMKSLILSSLSGCIFPTKTQRTQRTQSFLCVFVGSIYSIFILACSPNILSGFQKAGTKEIAESELYPFFREIDDMRFFNMEIDFRKNNFSGMLIIKKENADTYRAVMTSYFGMSVFDFQFGKDDFTVHYCLEDLNKKQVINTLRKDFENLFFMDIEGKNPVTVYASRANDSLKVYKTKKENHYYLVNTESKELRQMEIPHRISSLQYRFTNYNNRFPSQINIKHTNIGLNIQLTEIER